MLKRSAASITWQQSLRMNAFLLPGGLNSTIRLGGKGSYLAALLDPMNVRIFLPMWWNAFL